MKQFDYKANSNLVLPTDTSLTDKRPSNEATGEVKSLVGKLSGKMGDRISDRSLNPPKIEEDEKSRNKKMKKIGPSNLLKELNDIRNFSVAEIDTKDLLYQPKTDLTAAVYGLIIKFVRKRLVFLHDSIVNGAADEVISTMKDPNLNEESRRMEVENLLSTDQGMNDEDYNELCNLCKKINDWDSGQSKIKEDTAEEEAGDVGVAYIDEDDDESGDDYLSEVRDSGDEDFDIDDIFEKAEGDVLQSSKTLNLEEISKRQSTITPKIEIPEPIRKEGYQEYHIEPKKRLPHRDDNLIKIENLPEDERKAFADFKTLNLIQSRIYDKAVKTDTSLLICAPTGAGKTNIAILTMLREIMKHKKRNGEGFENDKFKIIYIAPIKALVQEVVENFTRRLSIPPYKLNVKEFTGDHQLDQRQISEAQIIVCTPEKWDIATRKSEDRLYTKLVKLVIFDEIHLLHDERGATVEALVARIKRHKQLEGEPIRIIGLSATLPNYEDVSRFIAPDERLEDSTIYFDSTFRPIPLKQQYIAISETKKAFRIMNEIVYDKVVERLVDKAQILIFVHSRPDTFKTADYIRCKALEEQKLGLFLSSESAVDKINEYSKSIRLNAKLKELLQFGIGVHSAALSKGERSCVEDLFRGKYIKVVVSTATLAWGVNLPARTVIIKGTHVYRDGKWTDLDSLNVAQMLGRAGRPGYDREGEGIVITQQSQVKFYMSLINEQLPVESKLIGQLAEFINAECVIGSIESLNDAVTWLSETYLSSRMMSVLQSSNYQYLSMYGIDQNAKSNDPHLKTHKHNLAYAAASILDDRGLIVFDRASGVIKSTELGRIASHYNCSSRTIKLFHDSIHEHTSDIEMFRTFSLADEFKDIFVRKGEEIDLQTLLNQVPFPIDDKRATPGANKVNALLQVYIFRLNIESSDLVSDMHFIKDNAARLASAIHELVLMKGYAHVAEISIDLCRKITKRMTICHTPLRQFPLDLDADIINRLEKKNYHIDELRALKADKITELLRCDKRQGDKIYKLLKCLPKLKVEASVKPCSKTCLRIELTLVPEFSWDERYHGYGSERFWLFIEDVNQEVLLNHELIYVRKNNPSGKITTTFFVPYLTPVHPFYFVRIFPDRWFGCDHNLPIYMEKLSLPDESPIFTQPVDLEPQSIRSLENPLFEKIYQKKFGGDNFNQIQTQAFRHIYNSGEDLILLASAGSGKTTCAELAIIRNINLNGKKAKCAYIGANSQSAQVLYEQWTDRFGPDYGVILLSGSHRADAAKVDSENSNIIIGDPETWHILTLTRSKKAKGKLLNKFQLFIIDHIHLLHNDNGSVLEWLTSKIVFKLIENPARIIALGSPMICADSLKNWLTVEKGTREPILLNYPPSIRPVKLELSIQKFTHYKYEMRLLTMLRPAFRHIVAGAGNRPVLIFVSDYARAKVVCEALSTYSKTSIARGEGHRFGISTVNPKGLRESDLETYIPHGIAYLYSGMDREDKSLVESLFESGRVQILVVTVAMCWSIRSRSYMTIIMDTQQHNGLDPTDYELTDVIQMVGLTGRSLIDHESRCIIMCHASKADYFDRFLREPLPAESDLPENLISHVNYEVASGSLTELNNIYKPYLAHTFFYKRISVNPNYYGIIIPEDFEQKSRVFKSFFNNLVNKVALELEKTDFITMEGTHENPSFNANLLSKISLEYYINYETLVNYTKWFSACAIPIDIKEWDLIELISTSTHEFRKIPVRHGELPALKYLQRRHRKREVDQLHHRSFKVKLLILSHYGKQNDTLEGELVEDWQYVIRMCYKLLKAIVDVAWTKDSFPLVKTAIKLTKELVPFEKRPTEHKEGEKIDMDVNMVRDGDVIAIDVTINREDDAYSLEEFNRDNRLPECMYRDEGWCFLVLGQMKSKNGEPDKFPLFKRVRTPSKGVNTYKLEFVLPEDFDSCIYQLYFMSDFYSTKEDKKVRLNE